MFIFEYSFNLKREENSVYKMPGPNVSFMRRLSLYTQYTNPFIDELPPLSGRSPHHQAPTLLTVLPLYITCTTQTIVCVV